MTMIVEEVESDIVVGLRDLGVMPALFGPRSSLRMKAMSQCDIWAKTSYSLWGRCQDGVH